MIAHCENAGDRMAILDAPPDLLPQDVLEWRMNTAGYDSKFAALYYPWIEVMNPLTNQPMMVPPSGHVAGVWCRTDATRGVHKAPANEVVLGANGLGVPGHPGRAGRPQQGRHQLHPRVPGPRHPHLGRAHAVERSRVALHQRPPAVQLRLRVDHGGHAVERVRAQRREAVDRSCGSRPRTSSRACGATGALFGATPEQAFYVKCDAETNPPEVIEAGQVICEIGIAPGEAGRVRDLPPQPVHAAAKAPPSASSRQSTSRQKGTTGMPANDKEAQSQFGSPSRSAAPRRAAASSRRPPGFDSESRGHRDQAVARRTGAPT